MEEDAAPDTQVGDESPSFNSSIMAMAVSAPTQ